MDWITMTKSKEEKEEDLKLEEYLKIPNTYEEWKKLSKEEKLRLWYVTPTSWFGEYQAEFLMRRFKHNRIHNSIRNNRSLKIKVEIQPIARSKENF